MLLTDGRDTSNGASQEHGSAATLFVMPVTPEIPRMEQMSGAFPRGEFRASKYRSGPKPEKGLTHQKFGEFLLDA